MKKKVMLIGIIIVLILLVTLGASVALYNGVRIGSKESSISVGDLTFKYTEVTGIGNGINLEDPEAISDEEGKQLNTWFDFKIDANLVNSDMIYEVSVEPTSDTTINLDGIKIYISRLDNGVEKDIYTNYDGENEVKTISDYDNGIIYQERILKNTKNYEKNFRVRIWISEDVDIYTDGYMGTKGVFKINVNAKSDMSMVDATIPVPEITGGTGTIWNKQSQTIKLNSIPIMSTATYEYVIMHLPSDIPNDLTIPTGTTENEVVINTGGMNYVYYRTVADDNSKSAWSLPEIVYIDASTPTVPVITGGNSEWTALATDISLKQASTADSGIDHYEYYLTSEDTLPVDSTIPTGTTKNVVSVDNVGITYVYYRAVSNALAVSGWSNKATVMIDRTAPVISSVVPSTEWDYSNSVKFTASDVNKVASYNVTEIDKEPTNWIPVTDFVEADTETKYQYDAAWARVFHHTSQSGTLLYTSSAEALSANSNYKYSVLANLNNYKNSEGKWEFLLQYPDYSRSEYNRWIQSINPATTKEVNGTGSEFVPGYQAIHIDWDANYWGGIALSSFNSSFIDGSYGHNNWYYAIGCYQRWNQAIPGGDFAANVANLWNRIDDKDAKPAANITATVGDLFENKTYYLWVQDVAGNISKTTFTTTKVDNVGPTITSVSPSTLADLTNSVTFTATDSSSYVAGYNVTSTNVQPTTWIPVTNFVETATETKYAYDAAWARVFHHNAKKGTVLFTNSSEALSTNSNYKYSVLANLNNYKNSANKWEFLLEYPDFSKTQYNRWIQSINPATTQEVNGTGSEYAPGYKAINIDWSSRYWGGIALSSSSTATFIDGSYGHSNWFYAIGAYTKWNTSLPGPSDTVAISTVNLWSRIDDKPSITKETITSKVGDLRSNGTYYLWVRDSIGNVTSKTFKISNVSSS